MSLYAASYLTYAEYLQTNHWRRHRRQALERAGHRCQVCGREDVPLEVHHNRYDNLFGEDPEDLIALCERCHRVHTEALEEQKSE